MDINIQVRPGAFWEVTDEKFPSRDIFTQHRPNDPNFLVQFAFTYRNSNSAVNKITSAINLIHTTTAKKRIHYICDMLLQCEILGHTYPKISSAF